MLLQPGKMLNMAFNSGLNAVGDTRYPMIIALFSIWGVAAGMSYWFGLHLGWGLVAIYCCMISDEYVRGILVFIRWRKRKMLNRAIARDTQSKRLEDGQPSAMPGESTAAKPAEAARQAPAEAA